MLNSKLISLIISIIAFLSFFLLIVYYDLKNPEMVTIPVLEEIQVYPKKNCRKKINLTENYLEKLDGYGSDSTEAIVRDDFEQQYYKHCVPLPNTHCEFTYYGDPISTEPSYAKDVEFNPQSFYAFCIQPRKINKLVKVPLIRRIEKSIFGKLS